MGFLAPLFLLSLLGSALPIWLHRLQSMSSERQLFSSAMLLERAEQRVHVRRKIKYRWLLALRIALLAEFMVSGVKPNIGHMGEYLETEYLTQYRFGSHRARHWSHFCSSAA
jgi:hypothetical protein